MIAVVSDLHLQQTDPDAVRYKTGDGTYRQIGVRRNVRAGALDNFFDRVCEAATRCGAEEVHVVFAGDIFELHRAPLWFLHAEPDVRPYGDWRTNKVRTRILDLLDHLEAEGAAFWEKLRERAEAGVPRDGEPPLPIRVHYVPGNHDRLANEGPEIRRRVRHLLAMPPGDDPFPVRLDFPDYGVRVRHGHEYDATNFPFPVEDGRSLDRGVEDYLKPAFGDYMTVEVGTRLALAFRVYHGAAMREDSAEGRHLRRLYQDLTEFDDVRPLSRLPEYLVERVGGDEKRVYAVLKPLLRDALEQARGSAFFLEQAPSPLPGPLDRVLLDAIRTLAGAASPDALRTALRALALLGGESQPAEEVRWEPGLGTAAVRFVVGGHTHRPEAVAVARAGKRGGQPALYLNTGTWRTTIPSGAGAFGRLRAYSMVFCYTKAEQLAFADRRQFETWTGHLAHRPPGKDEHAPDLALPYDEPARDTAGDGSKPWYRLRVTRLTAKKVPDDGGGSAEFRLRLGLDGADDRPIWWDGVKPGAVRTLSDAEGAFRLDPDLDGELR
ncbi:MAG: metallophosphoesterase, partial [Rhodothermales bacterium]|nr:metallophosphoesterase [Rhodothermales bacterium]